MKVRNARTQATDPGIAGPWKPGEVKDVSEDQASRLLTIAGFQAVGKEPKTPGHGAIVTEADAPVITFEDMVRIKLLNLKKGDLVTMAKTHDLKTTKKNKDELIDDLTPIVMEDPTILDGGAA